MFKKVTVMIWITDKDHRGFPPQFARWEFSPGFGALKKCPKFFTSYLEAVGQVFQLAHVLSAMKFRAERFFHSCDGSSGVRFRADWKICPTCLRIRLNRAAFSENNCAFARGEPIIRRVASHSKAVSVKPRILLPAEKDFLCD